MRNLTTALIVALGLLAAACGGGGGDNDLQVLGERNLQIQDTINEGTGEAFVAYIGTFLGGRLFDDISLEEGDDGRSFVAQQGTLNFAANVANLTDGESDRFLFELRAGSPVPLICIVGEVEKDFFNTVPPPGAVDFQGSDIRQIVLRVDKISFTSLGGGGTQVDLDCRIQILGTPPAP